MDERGSGGIKEQAFRAIIVPWLSLSIMDVDGNGTIDVGELKCLLWVHQEQGTHEPKDDTVRRTMAVLDLDFSGGENVLGAKRRPTTTPRTSPPSPPFLTPLSLSRRRD